MSDYITKIPKKINLSKARHDYNAVGEPLIDENDISEWALQFAILPYREGELVMEEEVYANLLAAVAYEQVRTLIDEGKINMYFDGNEFRFSAISNGSKN